MNQSMYPNNPFKRISASPASTIAVKSAEMSVELLTEEEAMDVEIHPAAYKGADGHSPYIGEDGYWYEYDDAAKQWKKTDVHCDEAAAQAALDAAAKATASAGAATAAAQSATDAAGRVDASVQAATDAAGKATAAATRADESAGKAGTSAAKADAATENADKATDRANAAAKAAEDIVAEKNIATKDYVAEQIDAVEIGGTNLFTGTKDVSFEEFRNPYLHWIKVDEPFKGLTVYKTRVQWQQMGQTYRNASIGETFTFSFYAKGDADTQLTIYMDGTDTPWFSINVHPEWKRYHCTFKAEAQEFYVNIQKSVVNTDESIYLCGYKLERGNKATDWSPAPEDISARYSRVTYDYSGRNLKEVFVTPEALHKALAAEDYSNIAVGDYWPITLNGTFWDYGSYTVPSGKTYYSNATLQTPQAGTTAAAYEGTYASDTAVSFSISGSTCYAATSDCLDHFERTCNATVKLEVAGINHYWRYGDSGELTGNKPHIVFVSRDCLPFYMRMQKAGLESKSETDSDNPWLSSALYKTLNDGEHGIISLMQQTELSPYIYSGPNGKGMRAVMENKGSNASNTNYREWYDRGKLFLPSESEVVGGAHGANQLIEAGLPNQYAIFVGSNRHISKGVGEGGARSRWWLCSRIYNNGNNYCIIHLTGIASNEYQMNTDLVPLCFVFV